MIPASTLQGLVAEAVRLGADTIELEYRDGYEEVSVSKGGVGFGIARFPSASEQAASLRTELDSLSRRRAKVAVGGANYEIRASL